MSEEPSARVVPRERPRLPPADSVPRPRDADPDADPDHPDHHLVPRDRARPARALARHHCHRLRHHPGIHGAAGRPLDRSRQRRQGDPDRRRPGLLGLHRLLGLAAIGPAPARASACFWASATCSAWPAIRCWRCARAGPAAGKPRSAITWSPRRWDRGFGPFVVGWLGGSAALPPTGLLFAIGLIAATLSVLVALLIRPAPMKAPASRSR